MRTIESLITKLCTYAPVDGAVDQMSKKFLSDSLPPFLTDGKEQSFLFSMQPVIDPATRMNELASILFIWRSLFDVSFRMGFVLLNR